jgi:hypothetical protein
VSSSRVQGRLPDSRCFGCERQCGGSALVLGEIALCWEWVAEGLADAGDDSRGRPHHFVFWAGS